MQRAFMKIHERGFAPDPFYPQTSNRTTEVAGNFSRGPFVYWGEDVMKAYFNNLPTKTWLLFVVPAVVIAYPVVRIVVPAVVHAVVPEVVRTVFSVI
jgi:hypothetical protein